MHEFAVMDWTQLSAVECVRALKEKRVTPLELLEAAAARIAATDAAVNATPVLCLARARRCIEAFGEAGAPGPLHGLPVLVKDTQSVSGVRWTSGEPRHAHRVGVNTDPCIAAVEAAGGVVIGKTNVPESAAGSHSFNPIFGVTACPFDTSLSAGGSSGGAAAALAVGQIWLATGSDLGGSLRQPAAFCGVCGLRPSYGLVPGRVVGAPPRPLNAVDGPMGRTVADVALLLDAMVPRGAPSSSSLPPPPRGSYVAHACAPLEAADLPRRVGWSADLGGVLRGVDGELSAAVARAAALLGEAVGAAVVQSAPRWVMPPEPPSSSSAPGARIDVEGIFRTLRADNFVANRGGRRRIGAWLRGAAGTTAKPEVVWNVLTGLVEPGRARRAARLVEEMRHAAARMFEEQAVDVWVVPCTLLLPFDKALRYPSRLAADPSVELADYIAWMLPCTAISLLDLPSISLPCGLSRDGRPLAVQLVGRAAGTEPQLLATAAALERAVAAQPGAAAAAVPRDPAPPPVPPRRPSASGPTTAAEAAEAHGVPPTDEEAIARLVAGAGAGRSKL